MSFGGISFVSILLSFTFLLGCGSDTKPKNINRAKPNPLGVTDDNLYQCMKSTVVGKTTGGQSVYADRNGDGVLTKLEALSIKRLNCFNRGLMDLNGVQHLKSLEYLNCSANSLGSLMVWDHLDKSDKDSRRRVSALRGLPNLKKLFCANNFFTAADCDEIAKLKQRGDLEVIDIENLRDGRKLTCDQAELVSHVPVEKGTYKGKDQVLRLSDVWGFEHKGEEYVAYADFTQLHIFKVLAQAPHIERVAKLSRGGDVKNIESHPNHSIWSEIRYYAKDGKAYLYASSEGNRKKWSGDLKDRPYLQIFDVTDIQTPKEIILDNYHLGLRDIHNIALDQDRGILLAYGGTNFKSKKDKRGRWAPHLGARLYSLEDPANPKYMKTVGDLYVHDGQIKNKFNEAGELVSSKLYMAHGTTAIHWDASKHKNKDNRFRIYDLMNLEQEETPVLYDQQYPFGYCHNIWVSDDDNYVIVTGETSVDNQLSLWKLTTDAEGKNVAQFMNGLNLQGGSLAHNAFIRGNHVYTSHYSKGVQVAELFETATGDKNIRMKWAYDTFPDHNGSPMNGNWGVYPFSKSSNLFFATDSAYGFFVFEKSKKFIEEENEGLQP